MIDLHTSGKSIVLVDSCGYACYRVGATLSWWGRRYPDDNRTSEELLQDSAFTTPLVNQFDSGLKQFSDSLCIFVRDCPKDEIWRLRHLPTYKARRSPPKSGTRPMGPIIKHLNTHVVDSGALSLRIKEAEADDVIAALVQYLGLVDPDKDVTIVTLDSDFQQLLSYPHVKLYNPRTKTYLSDHNPDSLADKIKRGDSTDNVPAIKCHPDDSLYGEIYNRILVDFNYIPRYIQDRVVGHFKLKSLRRPEIYAPRSIQLGLCCINTQLRSRNIFCSRTCRIQTVHDKGIDILVQKALENCRDLERMVEWNMVSGKASGVPVRVMRVSSDILPHMYNPKLEAEKIGMTMSELYQHVIERVDPVLKRVGALARKYRIRLTFHPGQYNVVGTPHKDKFIKTRDELYWHADVLDRMGCDIDSVIVIHGGGLYGDKEATIQRWIENYAELTPNVKRRLVLENCEKCFNIVDCLRVADAVNIPVVFDTHHFDCYALLHPAEEFQPAGHYIPAILKTWTRRGIKPKFHVSEQRANARIGAHSDMITTIPDYLMTIPEKYHTNIDIMIEAKLKEQAIRHLYTVYPSIDPEYVFCPTKLAITAVRQSDGSIRLICKRA